MQSSYSNQAVPEKPPPSTCCISLAHLCLLSFPIGGAVAKKRGFHGPTFLPVWPLVLLRNSVKCRHLPLGPLVPPAGSSSQRGHHLSAFLLVSSDPLFPGLCLSVFLPVCDSSQDVLIFLGGGGGAPKELLHPFSWSLPN